MAHVRTPTSAFACQVENLSAGGLFLRTEQQLPRGTGLQIELVKPGGRKPIELTGIVAGVITPEEAATARFIPGLGVQFTDIDADEANRLEELLTALGIDGAHGVVSADVRRTRPGIDEWSSAADSGRREEETPEPAHDAEAVLRDISEALEADEAPLATSKPALPPQPAGPPPRAAEPQPSEPARLMMQIRGLLFQLAEGQTKLRQREAEIEELRAELDDARKQIDQLQRSSAPRRMN
jgi:uncharacterized protein (TIGR02266 family)